MNPYSTHWSEKLEQDAKQHLPKSVYDFIAGAADDETVLSRNINAYKNTSLIPRVLVDVSKIDTRINIGGTQLNSPIGIAPTTPHKLLHPEGELATVSAASDTGSLMVTSFMASTSLEDIANKSDANLWFQLQLLKDKKVTNNLIQRATNSGYKALVITVDMPVVGDRRRDTKNKFKIPNSCLPINLIQEGLIAPPKKSSLVPSAHINNLLDPNISWKDVEWLRKRSSIPIFLKGILDPRDAKLALEAGVNGIIVSNHGGRQLGSVISTFEALPNIKAIINNKIPILLDGGIRTGADIVKALVSGADAILIGRPILWGLAKGGKQGVSGVLNQLNRELIHTMKLCGIKSINDTKNNTTLIACNSNCEDTISG